MNYKLFIPLSIIASTLSITANAQGIKFGEPVTTPVTVTNSSGKMLLNSQKHVTLMSIQMTAKQKQGLLNFNTNDYSEINADPALPSAASLGMNNVPVLDQGMHGSCVTFAVTAAVDAALGNGDYVSQLCQLELGSYLKFKGYYESGWSGTFAPVVYDQMLRFGIVNKNVQKKSGCAGVKEYPVKSFNEGNIMSPEKYRAVSEDISMTIHPHAHMDVYERFMSEFSDKKAAKRAFNDIKTALSKGNRVTFGIVLISMEGCSAGACVTNKAINDTWALTDDLKKHGMIIGGHEMVITGYDDDASVTDKNGKVHKGIFTIRNSWGTDVGDNGNYYMTYEYFINLFMEAHEVLVLEDDEGNGKSHS